MQLEPTPISHQVHRMDYVKPYIKVGIINDQQTDRSPNHTNPGAKKPIINVLY